MKALSTARQVFPTTPSGPGLSQSSRAELRPLISLVPQLVCVPSADPKGTCMKSVSPSPAPSNFRKVHRTDTGNAYLFAAQHRHQLRHCDGVGWLIYEGSRWRPAGGGEVTLLAKEVVAAMYREASKIKDLDERQDAIHWALASEGAGKLRSMIALAESELPVTVDKLDQDPWLLNCLNGTVDLRTGELLKHDRDDLITKLAPVEYDFGARSELWDRVLTHALPDEEVRDYFQKIVGYTLTGCTGEDIFALLHGPTRTSKGTVQEAIATMLGDYAITAELDLLAERDRSGGP